MKTGAPLVVFPASTEEAAEVLRLSTREGWRVLPAGAGTVIDSATPLDVNKAPVSFAAASSLAHIVVSTKRMCRVVEHEPADLVATAEAGVSFHAFNAAIAGAGQWLALDSPVGEQATLGGLFARGLGGAQALGYGPPRSKVLGMRVVLADGRVIRAGGRVVKNVAGYDLCKLFVGSRGTLGLITELTLRLRPLPACECTLVARSLDYTALLRAARAVIAAPLFPVAAELLSPHVVWVPGDRLNQSDCVLMLRFAGTAETVMHQLTRATEILDGHGAGANIELFRDEQRLWSDLAAREMTKPARTVHMLFLRASVLPAALDAMLAVVHEAHGPKGTVWHAGVGDGRLRVWLRILPDAAANPATFDKLRRTARECGGHLMVERAPAELRRELAEHVENVASSSSSLARRVKERLDPSGTFPGWESVS